MRVAALVLAAVVLAAAAGAVWLRIELGRSLPILDGLQALAGLTAEVRIDRDALGVPTITASTREDLARATGFLHAQDRFFQMDLGRRRAAGELAALFGRAVLPIDRTARVHRFRAVARQVLDQAEPRERAIVRAYTEGVNSGLAALRARPFEYLVLRAEPEPWKDEDCVLIILMMFMELQEGDGAYESALGVLNDVLPPPLAAFLAPAGTEWDAPLSGPAFETPPIPAAGAERIGSLTYPWAPERAEEKEIAGSNNWAISGARSADGRAILANDMHLGLRVPNTWYRMSFAWSEDGAQAAVSAKSQAAGPEKSPAAGALRRVTGVTLPGAPAMVVGSNGAVAWGFTNSMGDWSDLVLLEEDPAAPGSYRTPNGPVPYQRIEERIRVKGGADETLEIQETIWGPVLGRDHNGRPRALKWVAHDPGAVNFHLMRMESAPGLDEALAIAATCGVPAQNFVAADAKGRIGWTICGRIPRRVGGDGRVPASWADGSRHWDGWLSPEEYPRIADPPTGALWTANARTVDGAALARIGDGGYVLGARARQIRDALLSLSRATEKDLLALQLDDRALFLARWRDLLLDTLTSDAIASDPRRRELRALVETWGGRASVDSAGYRAVRAFRLSAANRILGRITAPCVKADPEFTFSELQQFEGPLWRVVSEKPPRFLAAGERGWSEDLLAAVDDVFKTALPGGGPLAGRTWGERNTLRIQHPLSLGVPLLGRWLDMPADHLPGDNHMPRVQSPTFGASERMVVSPGHEAEGYFEMPCGQSGHPLSPHYADGHAAWEGGEPTPFLPGAATHTLILTPGS